MNTSSTHQRTNAKCGDEVRAGANVSDNSAAVPSPTAAVSVELSHDARCKNCSVGFYVNGACDHCGIGREAAEQMAEQAIFEQLQIIFITCGRRLPLSLLPPDQRNLALTRGWMRKAAPDEPFYVPAGAVAKLIGE